MNKLGLTLLICMTLITSNTFADVASKGNKKLSAIHTKILQKYPDVKHINSADFIQLEQDRTLIFDVRELEEYAVSHLKTPPEETLHAPTPGHPCQRPGQNGPVAARSCHTPRYRVSCPPDSRRY